MNFTKAKMAIITICLLMDFLHGCIAWDPTGPGTQHQANQVQQPACSARQRGHTPNLRETGSDKPPSRGTGFLSDLIT